MDKGMRYIGCSFILLTNVAVDMPWLSEDIWVRDQPDGLTVQEHENPEYSMADPVYVYVRVRNKSCVATGSEPVKLYWAKAATALTWPQYWDGSITSPALMGAPIGTVNAPPLDPGEEAILEIIWNDEPNPDDYNGINSEPWHFCLLSRIDVANDPMYDEQWTGTWNLGHNVVQNNNIVWKNISIVNIVPGNGGGGWPDDKLMGATVAIGNATNAQGVYAIELANPREHTGRAITDVAEVRVTMDEATWLKWEQGGRQAVNLQVSREERFQLIVTGSPARIGNLHYAPHERSLMDVSFNFLTRELSGRSEFLYNAVQRDEQTNKILGGEQYVIRIPAREGFVADGGDDKEVLRNAPVELHAEDIAEDAIYNLYGPDGELLHTGKDLTVTADMTKQYKLEVIAQADGVKDYDQVEVKMKPASLTSVSPNPAAETATIGYNAQECISAYLMITIPYTGVTNNYILNLEATSRMIDVSNFPPGVYGVILVADGEMVDEIGLVVVQ